MNAIKTTLLVLVTVAIVIFLWPWLLVFTLIIVSNKVIIGTVIALAISAIVITFATMNAARRESSMSPEPDRPLSAVLPPQDIMRNEYDAFLTMATPGATITNHVGTRFQIIGLDTEKNAGIPNDEIPWYGPYYHVLVYWRDARPSESSVPWDSIGSRLTLPQRKQAQLWFTRTRNEGALP